MIAKLVRIHLIELSAWPGTMNLLLDRDEAMELLECLPTLIAQMPVDPKSAQTNVRWKGDDEGQTPTTLD